VIEGIVQKNEDKPVVKAEMVVFELTIKMQNYLQEVGLPSEDIFSDASERKKLLSNFKLIVDEIDPEIKQVSFYLSKFFGAAIMGLFDASLNYLWDAIIENLRNKVIKFDVSYFFDTLQNIHVKVESKNEDGLKKISDQHLMDGCLNIGLISDVVYQKMTLIQFMRNHASAAHPNINEITGFNLVDWLDFCNREIFCKEFPTSVATQRRFLQNVKKNHTIDENDVGFLENSLEALKTENVDALLKGLFNIYVDSETATITKDNIVKLIKPIWLKSSDNPKNQIGMSYANYSANLDKDKQKLTKHFLEYVGGLSYLTEDAKIIEIGNAVQVLNNTHNAVNNFYNEPSAIKSLSKYIPTTGEVPPQIRKEYVKTIVSCKIGNGAGHSNEAEPYYIELIDRFQTEDIKTFCNLVKDDNILAKLMAFPICRNSFHFIAQRLKGKAIGQVSECLDVIIINKEAPHKLPQYAKFTESLARLNRS